MVSYLESEVRPKPDQGEVKELGTHEELLAMENGIYQQLTKLQINVMA